MESGLRADALYLRHMLECIERIDEYVGGDELPRLCAALKHLEQGVSPPPPSTSSNQ